jgi:hypothetical protein
MFLQLYVTPFILSRRMFSTGTLWMSSLFQLKYLHTPNCGMVHTRIQRDTQCLMQSTLYGAFYFRYQMVEFHIKNTTMLAEKNEIVCLVWHYYYCCGCLHWQTISAQAKAGSCSTDGAYQE